MNVDRIVEETTAQGCSVKNPESIDAIIEELVLQAKPGDTIALLSNGAFGGIYERLLKALDR